MYSLTDKFDAIIAHERLFADTLALRVLERPKLSIWMILIPIIFLYFFYRYQRFTAGRKQFGDNYLINSERALNEAVAVIESGKSPDLEGLSRLSNLPDDVRTCNTDVLRILFEHYVELLRSEGNSFDTLIRTAYKTKANYLLYVNQLNQAEKRLNAAIEPHLAETNEQVARITGAIALHTDAIRREAADKIFAG